MWKFWRQYTERVLSYRNILIFNSILFLIFSFWYPWSSTKQCSSLLSLHTPTLKMWNYRIFFFLHWVSMVLNTLKVFGKVWILYVTREMEVWLKISSTQKPIYSKIRTLEILTTFQRLEIIFTVTIFIKLLGLCKKLKNPHRVKFVEYCHAFAECTTTNTEVVQTFWRMIWKF